MPREIDPEAVRRAQEALDAGASQVEAAQKAGKEARTIRDWLSRRILRSPASGKIRPDPTPAADEPAVEVEEDPTEEETEDLTAPERGSRRSEEAIPADGGSYRRKDPPGGNAYRPPVPSRREDPTDSRVAASKSAAEAARARVEEAEETLREKKALQALQDYEDQRAETRAKLARDERRRQERNDQQAEREAAAAAARLDAEQRAEAARAGQRRAQQWRREELPLLMARHVPSDALPGERAGAVQALQELLEAAEPDVPPTEAAVLAALIAPLVPYHERLEAHQRQEEAKARFRQAEALLRAHFPYGTNPEEKVRAEQDLRTRYRQEPDADPMEMARDIGRKTQAAVGERIRLEEAAERKRKAAEEREQDARSLLRDGVPYGATRAEREEVEALLEQRLREDPDKSALELVTPILNPLRAAVEKRAEDARQAAAKIERDRLDAAEKERKRETWEREADRRLWRLLEEVKDRELKALSEQEEEDGALDPASENFGREIRFLSEYTFHSKFHEALKRLKTGDDVDETAARILESHVEELLEKADREADQERE